MPQLDEFLVAVAGQKDQRVAGRVVDVKTRPELAEFLQPPAQRLDGGARAPVSESQRGPQLRLHRCALAEHVDDVCASLVELPVQPGDESQELASVDDTLRL